MVLAISSSPSYNFFPKKKKTDIEANVTYIFEWTDREDAFYVLLFSERVVRKVDPTRKS